MDAEKVQVYYYITDHARQLQVVLVRVRVVALALDLGVSSTVSDLQAYGDASTERA
jgi:hypothetical protein